MQGSVLAAALHVIVEVWSTRHRLPTRRALELQSYKIAGAEVPNNGCPVLRIRIRDSSAFLTSGSGIRNGKKFGSCSGDPQ
jgi:hypothetical protein